MSLFNFFFVILGVSKLSFDFFFLPHRQTEVLLNLEVEEFSQQF